MKTRFLALLTLLLCVNLGLAQVKIGEDPDNIDPASLVELESSDKAFVLTRVDDVQMTSIAPLNGALVYNISTQCIHYYDGAQWINLCEAASSGFSFADNGDGTFTLDDGDGNSITWNGAAEIVTTLVDNMDGSFSYTNEAGTVVTFTTVDADDQNLSGSLNLTTNELTINIEDGASAIVDLSTLEESADIAVNTADIAMNATDIATNATDITTNSTDIATNTTDITTNATDITTNATDIATNATDIATNVTDIATNSTDIATNATDIATNSTDIAAHVAADGDLDSTNELNSAVAFDGTNLTVTDAAGSLSADISALAYDDTAIQVQVATNTTDIATNATGIATNATDIATNATDIATNATDIATNTTDIATNVADIATNATDIATNSTDIATNATDIATNTTDIATNATYIATNATDIAAHVTADGDLDSTNELNSAVAFDGTNLTVTDTGGSLSADISGLAYDDTAIQAQVTTNTTDIATNTTDIATNATDIATNTTDIATNATDIATNATDIATNVSDIATNATDIATNATDIATNATDIAAHIAADLDVDNTNELNSAVAFDGTNLTVTDAAGSLSADISALAYDDTAIQAQVATNTTDIATNATGIATNATDVATNATDIATNTTDITTNATDIATNATDIAAHVTADGDLDSTNELNSAVAFDGTNLTVTDTGGSLSADISGLAYDDTVIQAQVATNTTDIATNATDIATNASDIATNATDIATNSTDIATNATDIATNATDIAAHVTADGDLDSTNELNSAVAFDGTNLTVTDAAGSLSADISALAYDDTAIQAQVATNTTDIATNATGIATNATDIATNATDIATNATDIATNTTDIAAHVAADLDVDSTNEIQTLSKAGNTITLSDGGGSVNETVTSLAQNTTSGVITYTDEASGTQTANVVSTDANNAITAGSDGGAYYGGYEKVVIWAEEAAALSSNTLEWSFGNGSTGQIGIPLPEAWEAYAVSFNADISGAGDTVTMAVINSATNGNLFTFTASGTANNIVYTQILATPVAIPAGTSIGFRTVTEVGNVSDARVAVWLRRRP